MSGNPDRQWDETHGARLRRARTRRGQTQSECANELRALGASNASQPTVSQWENGNIVQPTLANLTALFAYIGRQSSPGSFRQENTSGGKDDIDQGVPATDSAAVFADMTRRISGEPLLSHRQAALVDAYIQRLNEGPALSDADLRALELVASILGFS